MKKKNKKKNKKKKNKKTTMKFDQSEKNEAPLKKRYLQSFFMYKFDSNELMCQFFSLSLVVF